MVFSSDLFTIDTKNKTFIIEASDIDAKGCNLVKIITNGFDIKSEKTENIATFFFNDTNLDSEGELISWIMIPSAKSISEFNNLAGWKVVILND